MRIQTLLLASDIIVQQKEVSIRLRHAGNQQVITSRYGDAKRHDQLIRLRIAERWLGRISGISNRRQNLIQC